MSRFHAASLSLALAVLCGGCLGHAPPHPRAVDNNNLCAQAIADGQLDRAEVLCDHGLSFSPEYADLWVNKGLIALKRNQDDVAKDCFEKAIRYDQEHAQAYSDLGYIYFKRREYGRAHDLFQRALKVNPDFIEARYNLALTFKEMKLNAKARKEYRTILEVNPNIADAYADLGVMSYEEGALEDAQAQLSKAVELNPKYPDAWLNLGLVFMEAGKFVEAKDAFTSCLEADENNVACRNNVALANRKAQLLDPTLKDVRENQLRDNTAPSLYQLGVTYRERGLKNEEERSFRKCVRLDGKYAPCHYGLFLIFKEDRRDQEAVIACKNFLKFAVAEDFPSEVENCEKFVSSNAF